jgi:hypothetical protein
MATQAQALAYLQNLPGFTLLKVTELQGEKIQSANTGEYENRNVYEVVGDYEYRGTFKEKKFRVKVYDLGTPQENAVLEEPLPYEFYKAAENYVAGLGVLKYKIGEVDELNKIAYVEIFALVNNEMTKQPYVVYDDNGTIKHVPDAT